MGRAGTMSKILGKGNGLGNQTETSTWYKILDWCFS